jgi:hypothetical protein
VIVLSEKVNNTAYFEITSNTSWYITQNVDWITMNKTVGSGNEEITVLADSNETTVQTEPALLHLSEADM